MAKSDKIAKYQKNRKYETYSRVYDTLFDMITLDEKINFYTVADRAGVSRAYLYQHNAFSTMIKLFSFTQSIELTPDSLKEEYNKARERLANAQKGYKEVKAEFDEVIPSTTKK